MIVGLKRRLGVFDVDVLGVGWILVGNVPNRMEVAGLADGITPFDFVVEQVAKIILIVRKLVLESVTKHVSSLLNYFLIS